MTVTLDSDGGVIMRVTPKQAAGLFVLIAHVVPHRWGRELADLGTDLLMVLDTTEDDVNGYLRPVFEQHEPDLVSISLKPTKRKLPKLDKKTVQDA